MRIAIIDADLVSRNRHRFPNLACMKLSGYHREQGHRVELRLDYSSLDQFDKVYISKVFTDTPVPEGVLDLANVEYGGTGFFFDQAPDLPYDVEHHMPDYHLYDDFVNAQIEKAVAGADEEDRDTAYRKARNEFKEFLDCSIGFVTRGCFRKCGFCVNKKYDRVFTHSPLSEFYDPSRPKICLLDDNFFGHPKWKDILLELQATGKPIKFKQGLDERLLTDEKCELLCQTKYDGEITFAFDRLEDYRTIEKKLQMLRKYTDKRFMFYVLVAFDSQDEVDILSTFLRIELLMKYKCLPYIMRFEKYKDSPYRGMYINLARWCNQPSIFKSKSFIEFVDACGHNSAARRYALEFAKAHPEIALRFFGMKWSTFNSPQKAQEDRRETHETK